MHRTKKLNRYGKLISVSFGRNYIHMEVIFLYEMLNNVELADAISEMKFSQNKNGIRIWSKLSFLLYRASNVLPQQIYIYIEYKFI